MNKSENSTISTSQIQSYSPKEWFSLLPNAESITDHDWPWKNFKKYDWSLIRDRLTNLAVHRNGLMIYSQYGFIVLGYLGNLFIIITILTLLTKKQSQIEKTTNKYVNAVLIAIALFDCIYLTTKILRTGIADRILASMTCWWTFTLASSLVYSSSLMSDSLTLVLAIERYVALSRPVFHRSLSSQVRKRAWALAISGSFCLSCTRIHYAFSNYFYINEYLNDKAWFNGLRYFSDTIIPFVFVGLMIGLMVPIGRSVIKMRNKPGSQIDPNQQNRNNSNAEERRNAVMKDTINLLAVLLIMYFMNQMGYLLYNISLMMYPKPLTFASSYQEIIDFSTRLQFYLVSSDLSKYLETVSRSLIFYVYIAFNKNFRLEVFRLFERMRFICRSSVIAVESTATVPQYHKTDTWKQRKSNSKYDSTEYIGENRSKGYVVKATVG